MHYHRGVAIQQGAGLGSIFSGLFRTLVPVAKRAVKTVGRIVKSDKVKSVGKYLGKQATQAAVDTALEALEGKPIGKAAKTRLKDATKNILLAAKKSTDTSPTAARKRKFGKRRNVRFPTRNYKRSKVGREPLFDDDDDDDY